MNITANRNWCANWLDVGFCKVSTSLRTGMRGRTLHQAFFCSFAKFFHHWLLYGVSEGFNSNWAVTCIARRRRTGRYLHCFACSSHSSKSALGLSFAGPGCGTVIQKLSAKAIWKTSRLCRRLGSIQVCLFLLHRGSTNRCWPFFLLAWP